MTATATLVHSATISSGGSAIQDGWLTFSDGVITGVGSGLAPRVDGLVVDARGRLLTPGLVDMHGHGGGGASFTDRDLRMLDLALGLHRRHGTTSSILSLVSAPLDVLERQLGALAAAQRDRPQIVGAHLEGPFLDLAHKGAHESAFLTPPTPADVDRLIAAGGGVLRQVTLAPELPGAMDALRRFVDAGIVVAIGHTDADYSTAMAAFDAGARVLTHAFNGMNGMHHRLPGPVAAAIDHSGVTIEVISDGVHVHPSVVHLLFTAAPGRVALITDAMAAAGEDDGAYLLGSLAVTVEHGVARLVEGDSIAGSTLTFDAALRHAIVECGVDREQAVAASSSVPAAALGIASGRIITGAAADLVLFDDALGVDTVWAGGTVVE